MRKIIDYDWSIVDQSIEQSIDSTLLYIIALCLYCDWLIRLCLTFFVCCSLCSSRSEKHPSLTNVRPNSIDAMPRVGKVSTYRCEIVLLTFIKTPNARFYQSRLTLTSVKLRVVFIVHPYKVILSSSTMRF